MLDAGFADEEPVNGGEMKDFSRLANALGRGWKRQFPKCCIHERTQFYTWLSISHWLHPHTYPAKFFRFNVIIKVAGRRWVMLNFSKRAVTHKDVENATFLHWSSNYSYVFITTVTFLLLIALMYPMTDQWLHLWLFKGKKWGWALRQEG